MNQYSTPIELEGRNVYVKLTSGQIMRGRISFPKQVAYVLLTVPAAGGIDPYTGPINLRDIESIDAEGCCNCGSETDLDTFNGRDWCAYCLKREQRSLRV